MRDQDGDENIPRSDASATEAVTTDDKEKRNMTTKGSVFELPKCKLPPSSTLDPVAKFVKDAVQEQHGKGSSSVPTREYQLLIDALRFKKDLPMLHMILLSLRLGDGGEVLNMLASTGMQHSRLRHLVIRLNPFQLPQIEEKANSDRMDEYDIADAQLHLMMALISANSVFLIPVLTSLWNLLTQSVGNDTDALPVAPEMYVHSLLVTFSWIDACHSPIAANNDYTQLWLLRYDFVRKPRASSFLSWLRTHRCASNPKL